MSNTFVHYRLLTFPVEETPTGGLLDALHQESRRGGTDLLFDYHALRYTFPPKLFERGGRPWEHVRGEYVPRRLRFTNIKLLDGKNIGASLADLPPQDPERSLYAVLGWRNLDGINTYRIDLFRVEAGTLMLEAGDCRAEAFPGPSWKADVERNWSPVPLSPARLIPAALPLHCRFGGDPVTVRLKGQSRRLRLFVGGLDTQSSDRTDVQAVLNLSEKPSLWALHQPPEPPDRCVQKGEGSKGLTAQELAEEAEWVIRHLKEGKRVLVHCSAGMNRSSSVCCAVLILLEGLSAEAAFDRLRVHHPWARPDPCHWLALRWLATMSKP